MNNQQPTSPGNGKKNAYGRTFITAGLSTLFGLVTGAAAVSLTQVPPPEKKPVPVVAATPAPAPVPLVMDADYSYLCWSLRYAAEQGSKTATSDRPFVIEMNEGTMLKCPISNVRNVKIKISF